VLVRFPFSDLSSTKLRPACVLLDMKNELILAFITSVLKLDLPGDIPLKSSFENGLKKDSILRLSKIATLSSDLIEGRIGELSDDMREKMKVSLKQLLLLD